MNRSFYCQAVALHSRPFGENHREIYLLTQDRGLITAALYGGAKSKLRSLAAPYHYGVAWLYGEAARGGYKITDFDVRSFRTALREDLTLACIAASAAEIAIKTFAAGADSGEAFALVNGFLEGLSLADEEGALYGFARFLWRYALTLGVRPDAERCAQCDCAPFEDVLGESSENALADDTYRKKNQNAVLYYDCGRGVFLCRDCARLEEAPRRGRANTLPLFPTIARYLRIINTADFKTARDIRLTENDFSILRRILYSMMQNAAQGTLKTLDGSMGFLREL